MTETFQNWTAYDEWLVQHYNDVVVDRLDENGDGTVTAEWRDKAGAGK